MPAEVAALDDSLGSRPTTVLAGGSSDEREISLRSGRAVAEVLGASGIDARLIDPADTPVSSISFRPREVVFIALHGAYGEDGTCQTELESLGVPYTGCGPEASAIAFDKQRTRRLAKSIGCRTADGALWSQGDALPTDLGFPVVVKPAQQGSSVGLQLVRSNAELRAALSSDEFDARGSQPVLIEQYIDGDEYTVAVMAGHAYPPVAIEYAGDLFDFQAKYESSTSRYAPITNEDDDRSQTLRKAAESIYETMDARGLIRVDFIWGESGPVFLEVNTIPGLTARSLAPMAAAAAGITFEQLCINMLADAVSVSD